MTNYNNRSSYTNGPTEHRRDNLRPISVALCLGLVRNVAAAVLVTFLFNTTAIAIARWLYTVCIDLMQALENTYICPRRLSLYSPLAINNSRLYLN